MDKPRLIVNPEKEEFTLKDGQIYAVYAIPTELVTEKTDLDDLLYRYAAPLLCRASAGTSPLSGDILLISEKMLAVSQGKARAVSAVKAGKLARFLCRFVSKTDYGIGLAMPETMQCAIEECGSARILLAAAAGALGKLFGQKGWFYQIAGYKAAAVDGPCAFTIPPYDRYVVPAPDAPDETARHISALLGVPAVIIDCNDIGGRILGRSHQALSDDFLLPLLRQNPLGQSREQTPLGIIRKASCGGRAEHKN